MFSTETPFKTSFFKQEDVFQFYFPEKITFDKRFKNPLRTDPNASCGFYYKGNNLYFYDYSRKICLNHFQFVKEMFGFTDMKDVLQKIDKDLKGNLKTTTNVNKEVFLKTSLTKIEYKLKPFSKIEWDFWQLPDYRVKEQLLNRAGLFAIDQVYYNNDLVYYDLKNCYVFQNFSFSKQEGCQLYFPDRVKEKRYRSSSNDLYPQIQNLKQDDYVIITKSNVDALYLRWFLDLNSFGILNEGIVLEEFKLKQLKYKKVFTLFDNDNTGILLSENYKEIHNTIPIFIPKDLGKDVSDVVDKYGVSFSKNLIKQIMT